MSNKKKLIAAAVAVAILVFGVVFAVRQYRQYYQETYINIVPDTDHRRDSLSLDLSGQEIANFENIAQLHQLQTLDLRNTGITAAQYDWLQAALPQCQITWSVPFQEGYVDSTVTELTVDKFSGADLVPLKYLPALKTVNAEGCTDHPALMELLRRHPDLDVSYRVEVDGRSYAHTQKTLTLTSPDAAELMERLTYLPAVHTVYLNGTLPENEALLELQLAYPDITFIFDFEIFGVPVNTMDEFIDLSRVYISSAEEIDAIIPHFYNLKQIDMVGCGINNADMDALNKRYRDIKIVWSVWVCGVSLRTDVLHFMPWQYSCSAVSGASCYNLRYCTDIQVLDFGHYGINNVDFVEHMPNLKCLLMCDAVVSDITAIGNCISLEYIELQLCPNVGDFWPLTNLVNLKDLNLSQVAYRDSSALMQMPWLDRLWVVRNGLGQNTKTMLREALPNTVIVFQTGRGHTTCGFRYTPHYFLQRDILGMYYNCN